MAYRWPKPQHRFLETTILGHEILRPRSPLGGTDQTQDRRFVRGCDQILFLLRGWRWNFRGCWWRGPPERHDIDRFSEMLWGQMRVPLGFLEPSMPQKLLKIVEASAVHHEMAGKRVPQITETVMIGQLRFLLLGSLEIPVRHKRVFDRICDQIQVDIACAGRNPTNRIRNCKQKRMIAKRPMRSTACSHSGRAFKNGLMSPDREVIKLMPSSLSALAQIGLSLSNRKFSQKALQPFLPRRVL